jgi:hypothetical protein
VSTKASCDSNQIKHKKYVNIKVHLYEWIAGSGIKIAFEYEDRKNSAIRIQTNWSLWHWNDHMQTWSEVRDIQDRLNMDELEQEWIRIGTLHTE